MLARQGLVDFSGIEVDAARHTLQVQGRTEIESADIAFQAAIARLQCCKNLPTQTVESIFQELMLAEYECDQAEWERDCSRAADLTHARYMVLAKKPKA
jgi:hypothetical protein